MSYTYGWIFLTATLTHHLRDALRRGLWLYPYTTGPVPQWAYTVLMLSYPMICTLVMDFVTKEWLQRHASDHRFKYKTIEVDVEQV